MTEKTINWEQVAKEAKEIADAHGWNDPPEEEDVHEVNVLCELFEAWQLYRAGHEVDEPITCEGAGCQLREVCKQPCDQYKPYGIAVELADAVLRVLSRTGKVPGVMNFYFKYNKKGTIFHIAGGLEELICKCAFWAVTVPDASRYVAAEIVIWCKEHGVPIEDAIRQKMEYNKKRPWRHGGKRV